MFNYSEIEGQGRERLNAYQRDARHHDLVKRARSPQHLQKAVFLLRIISLIRTAPDRVKGTGTNSETTCQTLRQVYGTTSIK